MFGRILSSAQAGLLLVIFCLAALLTVFAGSHPDRVTGETVNNFLNSYTLIQTATDASFFAIMAVGATIVIISGGIDLSVGSIYALAGVTMAMVLRGGRAGSAPGGIAAARSRHLVGVGLLCGVVNGLMVVGLGVHPFIITLGTMWILRGIAFVAQQAESILLPRALTAVAKAPLGLGESLYPVPMLVMLAVTVARSDLSAADGDGPAHLRDRRQRRGEPVLRPAARTHPDRRLRHLGADRGHRGVHGRELLRLGVVRGRDRLRAVRDRLGGRRRREPVGRARAARSARCSARC